MREQLRLLPRVLTRRGAGDGLARRAARTCRTARQWPDRRVPDRGDARYPRAPRLDRHLYRRAGDGGMSVAVDIHAGELSGDGYCILRGALDPSAIEALAADLGPSFALPPLCQGLVYVPSHRPESERVAEGQGRY